MRNGRWMRDRTWWAKCWRSGDLLRVLESSGVGIKLVRGVGGMGWWCQGLTSPCREGEWSMEGCPLDGVYKTTWQSVVRWQLMTWRWWKVAVMLWTGRRYS